MSKLLDSIAGSAAGSAINSLFSGVLGNIQFKREKELLRNQQNFAYNMWKEQNAYNTPQAQMQRLLAAGISPTFAGQTVEGSYNSAISSPPANVPSLPSVSDSGLGSSLISTQMQDEISQRNFTIQKEANEIARINANANEVVALKNALPLLIPGISQRLFHLLDLQSIFITIKHSINITYLLIYCEFPP